MNTKINNLFIEIVNLMQLNNCTYKEADKIARMVTSELKGQRSSIEDSVKCNGDTVQWLKICNADDMIIMPLNQL